MSKSPASRHPRGFDCTYSPFVCPNAARLLRIRQPRATRSSWTVEEAAAKAHVQMRALAQARADLGIVTSRGNAGGVQAVQWSLPG
jgi:hypothetical protein